MADSNNILPAWGCNICFEESRDPVCTTCGHLFCWPCLYTWMHGIPKPCPVCRFSLTVDTNITPVYDVARANSSQGSASIPPRPHPARLAAPLTPTRAPTRAPTNAVPDRDSNMVHRYRETLTRVQEDLAIERTWLAGEEEDIVQSQNVLDGDARSLSRMSRELKELRRRNAVPTAGSGVGQASSNRHVDLDRPHSTDFISRVVNAIIGRRGGSSLL